MKLSEEQARRVKDLAWALSPGMHPAQWGRTLEAVMLECISIGVEIAMQHQHVISQLPTRDGYTTKYSGKAEATDQE